MRAAVVLLALFVATPGLAEPAPSALFPTGEDTCFATHGTSPGSTAAAMALVRLAAPDPLSEAGAWDRMRRAKGLSVEPHVRPVWGAVRLRGETSYRLAWLGCEAQADGAERCGIDCDGGGVNVRPEGDGLALRNEGMRLSASCGSRRSTYWRAGPHDTAFRLKRLDASACRRAMESIRPAFAHDGPPVAERIEAGRTSFERVYDAEHLARHPGQTVAAVRLTWTGFEPDDANRGRAALTIRLRGGRTLSQDLFCQPDDFKLTCFPQHGDGSLHLRRAGSGIKLDMRTAEELTQIGGHRLGPEDDVFRLEDAPAGPTRREPAR